jgi:hypothetical protein
MNMHISPAPKQLRKCFFLIINSQRYRESNSLGFGFVFVHEVAVSHRGNFLSSFQRTHFPPRSAKYSNARNTSELESLPTILAVMGNHDVIDGGEGFQRLFLENAAIGGWAIRQNRSYWAARAHKNWVGSTFLLFHVISLLVMNCGVIFSFILLSICL